jgi:ABC-type multidrug transport system permease subunit
MCACICLGILSIAAAVVAAVVVVVVVLIFLVLCTSSFDSNTFSLFVVSCRDSHSFCATKLLLTKTFPPPPLLLQSGMMNAFILPILSGEEVCLDFYFFD